MILKVWDSIQRRGWIYFDHIERIQVARRGPAGPNDPEESYGGGIYTDMAKDFLIATVERTWNDKTLGECVRVIFDEAFLLGDDGRTIERL